MSDKDFDRRKATWDQHRAVTLRTEKKTPYAPPNAAPGPAWSHWPSWRPTMPSEPNNAKELVEQWLDDAACGRAELAERIETYARDKVIEELRKLVPYLRGEHWETYVEQRIVELGRLT